MAMATQPFLDQAERIRWHRTEVEGLSQENYATRAGLKRSQIANFESGIQQVSLGAGRALLRTYGLSLDFIYEGISDALPMSLRKAWMERPRDSASK